LEPIPLRYTGDGEDVSPPLEWRDLPKGTVELALICEDPDAPMPQPWVHWVLYGLDPALHALSEGVPPLAALEGPLRVRQGNNTWGKTGYGGPAPPRGHGRHRYHFTLYALERPLGAQPAGVGKDALMQAMKGTILAYTALTGTYER
jgi:Raf kinase inhibitor-like YbhB/YbcL family protein